MGIGHFVPNKRDREFEFISLRQPVSWSGHSPEQKTKRRVIRKNIRS